MFGLVQNWLPISQPDSRPGGLVAATLAASGQRLLVCAAAATAITLPLVSVESLRHDYTLFARIATRPSGASRARAVSLSLYRSFAASRLGASRLHRGGASAVVIVVGRLSH